MAKVIIEFDTEDPNSVMNIYFMIQELAIKYRGERLLRIIVPRSKEINEKDLKNKEAYKK